MKLDFLNFIIQKVNSNDAEKCKDYRVISVNQIEFLCDKNNKTFIIPREEYIVYIVILCTQNASEKNNASLFKKNIRMPPKHINQKVLNQFRREE